MPNWDRFALGLVGALQAAEDRDMRERQFERQDSLLQNQLLNSDAERKYREAATKKLEMETGSSDAMAGLMTNLMSGGAGGGDTAPSAPPSTTQPGIKPTSMNPDNVNTAMAVLPPELRNTAIQEIAKTGLSPALVAAIPKMVRQESSGQQFRPDGTVLTSPKGARGIFQIMPGTAKDLGIDPDDPVQNVQGGISYLAQMEKRFKDPSLALAAYNAGPGAVARAGGIPQFKETQDYVKNVGAGLPTGSYDVAAGGNQTSDAYPATPMPSQPKAAGLPVQPTSGNAYITERKTADDWERWALGKLEATPGISKSDKMRAMQYIKGEADRRRGTASAEERVRQADGRAERAEQSARLTEQHRGLTEEIRRAQADLREQANTLKADQAASKVESDRLESWNKLAKDYTYEPIEDGMSDPERTQKQQRNQMRASALNTVLTRLDNKWRFQADQRAEVAALAAEMFKDLSDPEKTQKQQRNQTRAVAAEEMLKKSPDVDAVFKAVDNEVNLRTPEGAGHRQGIEDARNGARAGRSERNAVRDSRGWSTPGDPNSGAIQDEPGGSAVPISNRSAAGLPLNRPNSAITSGEERLRERGGIKPTPREMVALALAEDPDEQNLRERRRLDMEFLRGFPGAVGKAATTIGSALYAAPENLGRGLAGLVQRAMPETPTRADTMDAERKQAMYQHFKPIIDQYRRTNDPVTKARMLERARSQGIDLEELMVGTGR